MNPTVAKYILASGFFVLFLSAALLPFLKPEQPEFIPDVLAIVISLVFIVLVIYDVRRQVKREKTWK